MFVFQCIFCKRSVIKQSESVRKDNKSLLNPMSVWGAITSGMSFTAIEHFLNCMNVPYMTTNTFYKYETKLATLWHEELTDEILKAGIFFSTC